MKRTNYVGRTSEKQIGQEVVLKGWVASRRSFGGLIFIDLRDREGIVQLVFDEAKYPEAFKVANEVRNEYIIEIRGVVRKRAEVNPDMQTGTIEVEVEEANQLATSMTPPFSVKDDTEANEEMRLKYRFIDLRRPKMMNYLKLRSKMTSVVHRYFDSHDFLDVETPDLTRSTPEGARDFLVPSRMYPGHFYALPQSPQLFKQLLMASGVDRYYQMARCFRDEDLRGDRQPEFTQIDMEMSFASAEEIQSTTEGLIKMMMKEIKGIDIKTPFPRMKWQYAMDKYGTDKPDTRFEMLIEDLTDLFKNSSFKLFANEANQEHHFVRAICVPQGAEKYSRKDLEEKEDYIKRYHAKGLAWVKVGANGYTGTIADQISDQAAEINKRLGANEGDLILFVAGSFQVVCDSLGWLRREIGHEMHMMNDEQWNYMWLVDWPMFEYDEGWGRWIAAHHPFTMLNPEDLHYLNDGEDPHKAHAQSYDIILNGQEIGGGSIRVHDPKIQEKIFKALGYSKEEANTRFGFLIKGLEYGMPPEGGLAFGFDRWVLMLAHANSIRDVVPFPKNSKGIEPMTAAPGTVSQGQLDELHIAVNKNTGHVNPKD